MKLISRRKTTSAWSASKIRNTPTKATCTGCGARKDAPTWGIVAHWPAGEPLPNAGEQVTVHRKDNSTSVVKIKQVAVHRKDSSTLIPKIQGVKGLRYLSNGRAQLRCMIERDGQKPNQSERGEGMPETTIRECSTPDCTNTWEVEAEDDQRKICGLCEIEGVAQTPIPTAEAEGFDEIDRHISMAMKVGLRRMAKDGRGKPEEITRRETTTTFRQALLQGMGEGLRQDPSGPMPMQPGEISRADEEAIEDRKARETAWHALREWLPAALELDGMTGKAKAVREATDWDEMQNAIRDAFMVFLRESPLHLKAARSIGKAMDVARRAELLEETPDRLRWTNIRELLAADITMLGFTLVEADWENREGSLSLSVEYRRLLEGMDQTPWGDENCGETS